MQREFLVKRKEGENREKVKERVVLFYFARVLRKTL